MGGTNKREALKRGSYENSSGGGEGARGSARHNEPLPQPLEVHYRLFLTFSRGKRGRGCGAASLW